MFKKIIHIFVTVLCILSVAVPNCNAASDEDLQILQAVPDGGRIKVFFEVVDKDGSMIKTLEKDKLAATLGNKSTPINSATNFSQSGEPIAYVFLIDISKSIHDQQLKNIQEIMKGITTTLKDKDCASIITFGETVKLVEPFTSDKSKLDKSIETIEMKDKKTNLYLGISEALESVSPEKKDIPAKRVLIVMSDGNEVSTDGITKDEVYAKIEKVRVPIYTVGFVNSASGEKAIEYSKILGSFSRESFGQNYIWGVDGKNAADISKAISDRIGASFVGNIDCKDFKQDGTLYYLKLKYSFASGIAVEDGIDIRMDTQAEIKEQEKTDKESTPKKGTSEENTSKTDDDGNKSKGKKAENGKKDVKKFEIFGLDGKLVIVIAAGIIIVGLGIFIIMLILKNKRKTVPEPVIQPQPERKTEEVPVIEPMNVTRFVTPDHVERRAPPMKGKPIRLTVIKKGQSDAFYDLEIAGNIVIGRDPSKASLIFKDDERISSRHCELFLSEDKVFIKDLNSTNGTFVNGVPIRSDFKLQTDDVITVGAMEIRITIK